MLRSEVMQAQSASINGVSGATYTSEGVRRLAAGGNEAPKRLSDTSPSQPPDHRMPGNRGSRSNITRR